MKDIHERSKQTIVPTGYGIPFNQQATDNLLKQLQISLIDVEHIINKSKQSLNIKQTQINSPTFTRDISDINFHMSFDEMQNLSARDQLTYSASLPTNSQIRKQAIETANIRQTLDSINRKLIFQQNQLKNKQNEKEYKIKQQQKRKNDVPLTSAKNSSSSSYQSERKYMYQQKYQENYSIVINKGHKKVAQKQLDKTESTKKNYDYFNFNKQITNHQTLTMSPIRNVMDSKIHQNSQYFKNNPRLGRPKIFTSKSSNQSPTHNKSSQQLIQNNKTEVKLNSLLDSKDNTCSKNEMENILIMNYNQRKSKESKNIQRIKNLQHITSEFEKLKQRAGKKRQQSPSDIKNSFVQYQDKIKSPVQKNKKSPSKSPQLSTNKKTPIKLGYNKSKSPKVYSTSPSSVKKPSYIQKYIDNLDSQKPLQGQKSTKFKRVDKYLSNNSLKNSHPSKSKQKKTKPLVVQLQEHKQSSLKTISRAQFINKMLQQCYVRRFLNQDQLNQIYDEFCTRKVPRYQWEQKVIQKIFLKIHQVDELM